MKIERLSRLFDALGGSAQSNRTKEVESQAASNEEAVKVSAQFGAETKEASDREQKVAELKKQVRAGTYTPNSEDIARSVARELFF